MSQPIPVIALEYEHPAVAAASRPGRVLRILVMLALAVCVIAWVLIVAVDVLTVMMTGPFIAVLGGMVGVRGLIERRPGFTTLGAAHLGICVLFVVLVNWFRWMPHDAETPFTVMGAMHVVGSGVASRWMLLSPFRLRRAG